MNNSQKLKLAGQSIWFDNIKREILLDGTLQRMVEHGEIYGVTSNPSIFNLAISKSNGYDDAIFAMAAAGFSAEAIYGQLSKEDIRLACDAFTGIYESSGHLDGYVSIEVNPLDAHHAKKMITEANAIWKDYDRPNLMIKVPATNAGLVTIRQLIKNGINVNATLIFSAKRYEQVARAYMKGIKDRLADGNTVDHVFSVASVFVSRIDTNVDTKLGNLAPAHPLKGKAAVANSKLIYDIFSRLFSGGEFARLLERGANLQRPLWASTGTKNPAYSDTLYVDELVGENTVNTVPPATLAALLDHGKTEPSVRMGIEQAMAITAQLNDLGISLDTVGEELETEGVAIFSTAYRTLIAAIEAKRKLMVKRLSRLKAGISEQVKTLEAENTVRRIIERDATLWTDQAAAQTEISNRLGWLNLPTTSKQLVPEINGFRDEVLNAGFKQAFLLGMGGSSLAPEVFQLTFGKSGTGIELIIVDSTDPDQIRMVTRGRNLQESLFIVSSKSGGTSEVNAFLDYFWKKCRKECGDSTGDHFVAITDPGTSLELKAKDLKFRKIFSADPMVGGRFSALTVFGLLPAALAGIDIEAALNGTSVMMQECSITQPSGRNPGLVLGAILGHAATFGVDKLSLLADPEVRPFCNWVEQLVAESSGKDGKGILPVVEEFLAPVDTYGEDRLTVYLRLNGAYDTHIRKLEKRKLPLLVIPLVDKMSLFKEFYRWGFATAVACGVLKVNAFDQPDVQDNKTRTISKIAGYEKTGNLNEPRIAWENNEYAVYSENSYSPKAGSSIKDFVRQLLATRKTGDYVAINAYLLSLIHI